MTDIIGHLPTATPSITDYLEFGWDLETMATEAQSLAMPDVAASLRALVDHVTEVHDRRTLVLAAETASGSMVTVVRRVDHTFTIVRESLAPTFDPRNGERDHRTYREMHGMSAVVVDEGRIYGFRDGREVYRSTLVVEATDHTPEGTFARMDPVVTLRPADCPIW